MAKPDSAAGPDATERGA